jgi:hypothetical protein
LIPSAKRIRIGAFQYRDATSSATTRHVTPSAAFVADDAANDAAEDGPSGVSCAISSAASAMTSSTASLATSLNVKQVGNEQFEMRFDVDPSRFGALLGQGGRVKRQLEAETGGSFVVPKSDLI